MKFCYVFIAYLLKFVVSAPAEDLVTSLPGYPHSLSFKQYSGYLAASPSKHFHYLFVESERDPINDPVVLWLNGGPGCSSMDGYLSENGPLHVNDDGETLYSNPYSWNRIANVLYLESPAGVGYSYDDNGHIATNDDEVSLNNYNALVDFFKKFPEYQINEFFITGESYAGVYNPTLSVRILQGSFKINFKGVAIGNGLMNADMNVNSLVLFGYYHGLFGEELKKSLTQACCDGDFLHEKCNFTSSRKDCVETMLEFHKLYIGIGLNPYSLYRDCYTDQNAALERFRIDSRMLFPNLQFPTERVKTFASGGVGASYLPCINATATTAWFNKQDVREALHIKSGLPTWGVCNVDVSSNYIMIYRNLKKQFEYMFDNSNLRILIYNGDTDMVCNFLGDEWFVDDLNRPMTKSRAPWYVKGQVAGFVKTFDRITFTTIRGSGHMVPQWAPDYAYAMFDNFINNKPFNLK